MVNFPYLHFFPLKWPNLTFFESISVFGYSDSWWTVKTGSDRLNEMWDCVFGFPHNIAKNSVWQMHKYGFFSNFKCQGPLRDWHLRTYQILRGHTRISVRAYFLRPNNASYMAARRTMWHAGTKSARPSIAPLPELQWKMTLIELLRPCNLGLGRRSRSDGRKLSIPLTSRTLAARNGEPSIN